MEDCNKTIVITMEEYRELLITKGRYEELKSKNELTLVPPTYKDFGDGVYRAAEITS